MSENMEAEHSPTPWTSIGSYIDDSNGFAVADTFRTSGSAMRHTNAARIVACVNACEGVDNADLTHGCYQKLIEKHVEVCFAKQDLEDQRDELLRCFKLLTQWLENRHPNYPNRETVGAVIAKAEGWQFTPPESEGLWLISCGETAYRADKVLVERRGDELWCTDPCLGTCTVLDYHDFLTNARWKKAEEGGRS